MLRRAAVQLGRVAGQRVAVCRLAGDRAWRAQDGLVLAPERVPERRYIAAAARLVGGARGRAGRAGCGGARDCAAAQSL
eukprot:4137086-Prymnesium_polylepis.1